LLQKFDNWVIVESPDKSHHRVLAGSSGSYLNGDSWKLNSGIAAVTYDDPHLFVKGESGSVYQLNKDSELVRMNIAGVLSQIVEKGWKRVDDAFGKLLPELEKNEGVLHKDACKALLLSSEEIS